MVFRKVKRSLAKLGSSEGLTPGPQGQGKGPGQDLEPQSSSRDKSALWGTFGGVWRHC